MIAENLPYPPLKGGDLRSWQNINGLITVSEVGVFGLWSKNLFNADPPPIGLSYWRISTDAALAYPPPKDRKLAARAWLFDPMGHPSDIYYSDTAADELAEIMRDFRPHVVVVETLWLHRYIEILKRYNCRIVLDCFNVEASLYQQIAECTSGKDLKARLIHDTLPARTRLIEQKAIKAADQVWVCSRDDARLMEEMYEPGAPIHVIPNTVDVSRFDEVRSRKSTPGTTEKSIIFPGIFDYPPNAVAAEFLIEQLFPKLAALFPDCKLLLVGNPTPRMTTAAKGDPRVVLTGHVADVRPYLKAASVMVVPLFQGSGTRFKILEAFASNLPVVSTAKGAEGIEVKDGTHLLMAETAEEFVTALKRLWTDEGLAKHLAPNALNLVKECYSWDVASGCIAKAVKELDCR
jgi:glycosyltransferase involved in cell wall biosynthesis